MSILHKSVHQCARAALSLLEVVEDRIELDGWAVNVNKAYGDAKLANILFKELQRLYGIRGIAAACFQPGGVATRFAPHPGSWMRHIVRNPLGRRLMFISPDKGAETLNWLADGTPGRTWQPA